MFFDPVIEINTSDLKNRGYNYLDEWNWYQKVDGDTAFIYRANFDEDPVFTKIVHVSNFQRPDSVELTKFVKSKGGVLVSRVDYDGKKLVFFVQGQKSGLYSKCLFWKSNLEIIFHFPDNGGVIRSKYRVFSDEELKVEILKGTENWTFSTE